jgi:hypothetical protein
MKYKIGPTGMKWLKTAHLVLVVFFLGGILSSLALNWSIDLRNYEQTRTTYEGLGIISDQIIRYGAVGTLILAFVYGFFTTWGFFKHRWLTVKWVLFIAQTFIGILIVDRRIVANVVLLETENAAALSNPVFLSNHVFRQYFVIGQIAVMLIIIAISVFKPWRNKRKPIAAVNLNRKDAKAQRLEV